MSDSQVKVAQSDEFNLTKKLVLEASKLHIGRWFSFWTALSIIHFMVLVFLFISGINRSVIFALAVVGLVPIKFAWMRNPWFVSNKQVKTIEQTMSFPIEMQLTITDSGIEQSTDGINSEVSWTHLYKWNENNLIYIIYYNARQYFIIPKSELQPITANKLQNFLHSNLGKPGKKGLFW